MKTRFLVFIAFGVASLFAACDDTGRLAELPVPDGDKTAGNTNPLKIENPYYWWAKDFPGDVQDSVPRLQEVELTVNGNYKKWSHLKINTTPSSPYMSTGLYVPVAEMVTVEVPENITGLKYRIGAYHCTISDTTTRKRYDVIVKTGDLKPGKNEIFNYFGGHLYIMFTDPIQQTVTLKISGAVKSPDFILGETDVAEWRREIAATGVPWAEMSCDRMILTMPVKELQKVGDPVALMEFYQEFVNEDYNKYAGMTGDDDPVHGVPTFPWRYIVDKQLCAGAGHNGYPFVGGLDWAAGALSLTALQKGDWGTYHELGHNYQTNTWKWGALGEVSNNLHVYHMMNRKFGVQHPREIEPESAIKSYLLRGEVSMDDWDYDKLSGEKVFWALVPLLQLTQEYGWLFYAYLAREGRENGNLGSDQAKRDFFVRKAAEYANADLGGFFDAWRITMTPLTRAYLAQFPAVESKFWESYDRHRIGHFTERTPVKKDEPDASDHDALRTDWKAEVSSMRQNNKPELLFDGTNETFWQSDWSNTDGSNGNVYPHWVVVDMQKALFFNYIYYQHPAKQNISSCARKIQISVSDDKTNWTIVKNGADSYFYLTSSRDRQTFYVSPLTTRYIKYDLIAPQPASGKPSDEEKQQVHVCTGEVGVGEFR